MEYKQPAQCSVCGGALTVTQLTCPNCSTVVSGSFSPCRFCALNDKMSLFLDAFLKSRGNIKEVEKRLSISYPTVKSLLDELLTTLYPDERQPAGEGLTAAGILDKLDKGEITVSEATALLAGLRTE